MNKANILIKCLCFQLLPDGVTSSDLIHFYIRDVDRVYRCYSWCSNLPAGCTALIKISSVYNTCEHNHLNNGEWQNCKNYVLPDIGLLSAVY
jgi:hypothetical protein